MQKKYKKRLLRGLIHYRKLSDKLFKLPFIGFVFVILFLSYAVVLPFAFFDDGVVHPIHKDPFTYRIFAACIIAPLWETMFYQVIPIHVFTEAIIKKRNIAIFLSALFFGIVHYFSLVYIAFTFAIGLLFAWAYLNYYERYGFNRAFWAITIVHALRNAIAVVAGEFLG